MRRARRAAVCSYGYGGTIAHILLEEAPPVQTPTVDAPTGASPRVVPISAKSGARLRNQAGAWADRLRAGDHRLDDVAAAAWTRRSHEGVRAAVVAEDIDRLVAGLDSLAAKFPKARFIMAHVGGMYNWPKGIDVALKHDNIFVDTSGAVMLYLGAMEHTMKKLGPSRVLFGVDFPLIKAAPLVAALEALDLSPDDFDRVAWKNAAELFHLDPASLGPE